MTTKLPFKNLTYLAGKLSIFAVLISAATEIHAAAPEDIQPVKVGEADLFLSTRLDYVNTDNEFLVEENEESSSGLILSPQAVLIADKGTLTTEFSYAGSYGAYEESLLNFDDHKLNASIGASISKRLRVGAVLGFRQDHESPGELTSLSQNPENLEVIESQTTQLTAAVAYGAEGARGNLRFDLLLLDRTVDSDVNFSGITSDHFLVQPGAEFSYRISGDTRLTFDLTHGVFDFDNDSADRSITRFFVGLRFAASGKLSGSARIGVARTDFDSGSRGNINDFVVSSSLVYQALSHSKFTLTANRRLDNQEGTTVDFSSGDVVNDEVRLVWNYKWSSRFSHTALVEVETIDRACPDPSTLTRTIGLELNLALSRWLSVGANVSDDHRTGDVCSDDVTRTDDELDFDRQEIGVFVRATL